MHEAAHSKSISPLRRASRRSFDAWECWSASAGSTRLQCVWAMAEATVWPILADFLLVPLVLGRPRRAGKHLAGAVSGMALGGIGLYLFAFQWPARSRRLLHRLPTVHAAAIERAEKDLAAHGLAAFLFQPVSGIPFKVWALLAGSEGRSPLRAIPLFIVARAGRMAIVALAARLIGLRYRPFLRDYFLILMTLYLAGFLYVWRRLIKA
jgi:1-acyl-sn-glycerol-3-phosphate acyltransferase